MEDESVGKPFEDAKTQIGEILAVKSGWSSCDDPANNFIDAEPPRTMRRREKLSATAPRVTIRFLEAKALQLRSRRLSISRPCPRVHASDSPPLLNGGHNAGA
jgi:hypothetical protein